MILEPNTRYKIAEGPDGIFWVSLQPLLADVKERIDAAEQESVDHMTHHAMKSVEAFVNALISEGNYEKYIREKESEIETETPYSQSLQ